jgi:hypothetical protein
VHIPRLIAVIVIAGAALGSGCGSSHARSPGAPSFDQIQQRLRQAGFQPVRSNFLVLFGRPALRTASLRFGLLTVALIQAAGSPQAAAKPPSTGKVRIGDTASVGTARVGTTVLWGLASRPPDLVIRAVFVRAVAIARGTARRELEITVIR